MLYFVLFRGTSSFFIDPHGDFWRSVVFCGNRFSVISPHLLTHLLFVSFLRLLEGFFVKKNPLSAFVRFLYVFPDKFSTWYYPSLRNVGLTMGQAGACPTNPLTWVAVQAPMSAIGGPQRGPSLALLLARAVAPWTPARGQVPLLPHLPPNSRWTSGDRRSFYDTGKTTTPKAHLCQVDGAGIRGCIGTGRRCGALVVGVPAAASLRAACGAENGLAGALGAAPAGRALEEHPQRDTRSV